MPKKFNLILLILVFIFTCAVELNADILYLKNGREIEGIVKNEQANTVGLEVCSGTVQFTRNEVERIEKSAPEETQAWFKKCLKATKESQGRAAKQGVEKKPKGGQVKFSGEGQGIVLEAILNNKVKVSLVLDTGASLVILRKNIAEKLGIDLKKTGAEMEIQLADGRTVKASYIVLDSLSIEDAQAKKVEAAILWDDLGEADFKDGLLGRSYLQRFNFKVDYKDRKLTLEKL